MTDSEDLTEVLALLYQGLMLICKGLERIVARRKGRAKRAA